MKHPKDIEGYSTYTVGNNVRFNLPARCPNMAIIASIP
jgi:hypothetical protein